MTTYADIIYMMRWDMATYACPSALQDGYICAECHKLKYCGVDTIMIALTMIIDY